MFTGLIQDVGTVADVRRSGRGMQLGVTTAFPIEELELGESIAVNGVCLTVVELGQGRFDVDVSPETVERSTIGALHHGDRVNLERALRLCDRLGGHLVSGHIDGTGQVSDRRSDGNAERFTITVPPSLLRYMVDKGSVALDGISLTVNKVDTDSFSVAIIPHSLAHTTLNNLSVGSRINIEADLLAKYVEKLLKPGDQTDGVDLEMLAKHGFL
ncbi:MAG: riboflavin synthase [Desulfuromonas sp.]|nr:MAG: riboflavin synthase [Desulfuromonas sp.]